MIPSNVTDKTSLITHQVKEPSSPPEIDKKSVEQKELYEHHKFLEDRQVHKVETSQYQIANKFNISELGLKSWQFNFTSFNQYGETCKTQSIANIDTYFAAKFGYRRIPMFKHMHEFLPKNKRVNLSIRELAKRFGSRQGEILEKETVQKIGEHLGYKVNVIEFNDIDDFKCHIKTHICEEIPLMIMFGLNRFNLLPIKYDETNEHAAVIHGFKNSGDKVIYSCDCHKIEVKIEDLYLSNKSLPITRLQEVYSKSGSVKHISGQKYQNGKAFFKYHLVEDVDIMSLKKVKFIPSVIPKIGSGFNSVIFAFSPLESPKDYRKQLIFSENLAEKLCIKSAINNWDI